ncbi:hypothetical protein [Crocosphaera sp. XPORK-15E]|uniref:hypothetical protein n=1 Tax=Crocosphaera sp. XPORK-15E TaxID=3110247 RepID=UPI002B1EEA4C|nr:hypothetical protein [Crocosphaera sp. XPORK-15E]MEA5534804.1 hypothetical protein [Crocosphaera sp. XPORK-15E]
MMTRLELLNALINFNQPLSKILPSLNTFKWDFEQELIILKRQHIIQILNRYLADELSVNDIENWANGIESREDIGYEENDEDFLINIIYELANPYLTQQLSVELAQQLQQKLSDSTIFV